MAISIALGAADRYSIRHESVINIDYKLFLFISAMLGQLP